MPRLQLILLITIILLGGVLGALVYRRSHQVEPAPMCPLDVMVCPDGSSVPRSGPNCEFGVCKQELPSYMIKDEIQAPQEQSTSSKSTETKTTSASTPTQKKSVVTKVTETTSEVVKKITNIFTSDKDTKTTNTPTPNTPSQEQKPTSEKNAVFNETRYTIQNNKIVDENGNVIYTLSSNASSSAGWTTHYVNVVPTNSVSAVINSIPIVGSPGQFYLSENSLGNVEKCEFTNKVYILDTKTGSKILMYEENSNTIGANIARSCTSELFLLATEAEKLILKSHTVGTGTVCESTWSEPEQTWFLDVTKLEKGLNRYFINPTLYYKAEGEEKSCRTQYESTSTPDATMGG